MKIVAGPLAALFKSRKFLTALATAVAYVLALAVPATAQYQSTVAGILLVLAGLVIGGITLEDAAKSIGAGPQNLRDAIHEIVYDILDSEFPPEDTGPANVSSSASQNPPSTVSPN